MSASECELVAKYLGSMFEKQDNDGNTRLHTAAAKGDLGRVGFLAGLGLIHSIKNNDGHTALELAQMAEHNDVVELITQCLKSNIKSATKQ